MTSAFSIKRALLLCFMGLVFLGGCGKSESGKKAPDFSLQEITGKTVSLKQYLGHIVVLDFWATWCPPCRRSIPELVAAQGKYRKKGLVVLGISLDNPEQVNNTDLEKFKNYFKINYQILRVSTQVLKDYFGHQSISIPTMFFINRKGDIVDKHVGFSPGEVEASLKNLFS